MYPRIKKLRTECDLTQQQVAGRLGIQREVYRRYESGEREIKVTILTRLATLYGVSCDYILDRTDKRNPFGE